MVKKSSNCVYTTTSLPTVYKQASSHREAHTCPTCYFTVLCTFNCLLRPPMCVFYGLKSYLIEKSSNRSYTFTYSPMEMLADNCFAPSRGPAHHFTGIWGGPALPQGLVWMCSCHNRNGSAVPAPEQLMVHRVPHSTSTDRLPLESVERP